jgi:hypothetical protein
MNSAKATREQALDSFGAVIAASDAACAQMTPREQAEAAWTPTSPHTVDELEDLIRADRGLAPIHDAKAS